MNTGTAYSFNLGTDDWSFVGSSPCPAGVESCYEVQTVSVTVNNGASVTSSSHSWGGSVGRALSVSVTVSNRLGPVSVTYAVTVRQYEEQTLSRDVSCSKYDIRPSVQTDGPCAAA